MTRAALRSSIVVVSTCIIALASAASEWKCCTTDDPISYHRQCTSLVLRPDKPYLVKELNYTRYHDPFGGNRSDDPDPRWNSMRVDLARLTDNPCDNDRPDSLGCNILSPVCILIDCLPLCQDKSCRTLLDGKVVTTDFTVTIPAGAGPDGDWYSLTSSLYDRHRSTVNDSQNPSGVRATSSFSFANNFGTFIMTNMSLLPNTDSSGLYPFERGGGRPDPWPGLDVREVPCRAYPCARTCVDQAFGSLPAGTRTQGERDQARACIDKCVGVDDVTNYCPDVGGTAIDLSPQRLGFDSQAALDAYIPDGCVKFEGAAYPAEYASYSSSLSAAAESSRQTVATTTTAMGPTATPSTASSQTRPPNAAGRLGVPSGMIGIGTLLKALYESCMI